MSPCSSTRRGLRFVPAFLPNDFPLAVGDVLEITVRGAKTSEPNSITVNYDGLIDDLSVGDVVLLDNGLMQVRGTDRSRK